jgi:CBS domain-containing protein
MNPDVVCVRPQMTAAEVQRLLAERNVGGAPVVDDSGHVVGVISQSDLVRHALERTTAREAGLVYSDDDEWADVGNLRVDRSAALVEKLMRTEVLSVNREDSAALAANIMRERRVHRLLVTERGRLVGVITSFDLLRVVEEAI